MKDNFEKIDNYITEENVNSHFKYEFIPTKIECRLTNFIVYDLETHNTDRARLYVFCCYRLSKLAGKYKRDLSPYELENGKKYTFLIDCDDCNIEALDFLMKIQRRRT